MTVELESKLSGCRKAEAQLTHMMTRLIPKRLEYRHGMTTDEVEKEHRRLVKKGLYKHFFSVYDNKLRTFAYGKEKDYSLNIAGKHMVHGRVHYFPLSLDRAGLIEHSKCDCEAKT